MPAMNMCNLIPDFILAWVASMAEIRRTLKIMASPQHVFKTLTTEEGLTSWYARHTRSEAHGAEWHVKFVDCPANVWQVTEARMVGIVGWKCTHGASDMPGTRVTFKISEADNKCTLIELAHVGWPGTHGEFRKCDVYWRVMLRHLKEYAETGLADPAFN